MENNSIFPMVEIKESYFMPDRSLVIKTSAQDGSMYINRYISKSVIFSITPYSDWPVMIADGGCLEFKPEASQVPKNKTNQNILPEALEKTQEIINQEDVKKISAILDDSSIIAVAEKISTKKKKKTPKKG
jgi:hypothetical protein